MMHFFYLARCSDGSLYAGTCMNLKERETKHNDGTGAKYTRSRRPVKIIYHEEYETLSQARSREALVKQWPKEDKERLLSEGKRKPERETRCIAVIGMNGVGKSNFGRILASKLRMKRVDVDSEFRKIHGEMDPFIEQKGWDEFRKEETMLVHKHLQPGYIVVLGGGAVESLEVREILKKRALVIWLQGDKSRIKKQLHAAKRPRPEFRRGVTASSVENLLNRRNPHYEELADIRIPSSAGFAGQVPVALNLLRKKAQKRPLGRT